MTREETKKIIMIMSASYPNYKPIDLSMTVDAWSVMLSEYEYEKVETALKAFILSDNSGFAPSIGQLVEKINMLEQEHPLNEMEAWLLVSKALRNGYYGAEEEFEKLPEMVQKAVGHPGNLRNWSQTDILSVENVVQSNFIKTYRSIVKRETEKEKLPPGIQSMINVNCLEVNSHVIHKEESKKEWDGVPMPELAKEKFKQIKN